MPSHHNTVSYKLRYITIVFLIQNEQKVRYTYCCRFDGQRTSSKTVLIIYSFFPLPFFFFVVVVLFR